MSKLYFYPSEKFSMKSSKIFEEQKRLIHRLLPRADIQHVGSTAIPGSITKGDVDINIRVTKEEFDLATDTLKKHYKIAQRKNWGKDFASFKSKSDRRVGVQLTIINSKTDHFVYLRNILIENLPLLEEYNQMKKNNIGKKRSQYRKAKSKFLQRLKRARKL